MKKLLLTICVILFLTTIQAESSLKVFKTLKKSGLLSINKINISLVSTYGNWRSGKFINTQIYRTEKSLETNSDVKYPDGSGKYLMKITEKAINRFKFDITGTLPKNLKPKLQFIQFTIPLKKIHSLTYNLAGTAKTLTIPEKKTTSSKLLENWHTDRCSILMNNGDEFTLSGYNTMLYVQDNRHWKGNTISVRLWLKNFDLSFLLDYQKNTGRPVPLSYSANSVRRDEIADDKQGGWTDQGKSNDLRMLKPGTYHYGNIPFAVAEEHLKKKGTIVIAGTQRNIAPAEIDLPLPPDNRAGGLALLHCSAWTPRTLLGEIDVFYDETGVQTIPVYGGRDVGNWWGGNNYRNAKIVWKSSNPQMPVGIHASFFPLNGRTANRLRFRIMNPKAVWMILGVTLLNKPVSIEYKQSKPIVAKADKNWLTIDFSLKTRPKSPMDFSFINRELAPAGKWGRMIVSPQGSLTFEKAPKRRFRINGTNLCSTACFLPKEDVDRLTDYFLSMGINSVRLHHHDTLLVKRTAGKMELDPVNVDRMDYLIAQCKKKGIYITTDLYTSRKLRPGELAKLREKYPKVTKKRLIQCTDEGLENWKTFARLWLTHRNPYTGMTLAEDPVLVFINLVNEDTLTYRWNNCQPVVEAYRKYAAEHGIKKIRTEPGDLHFGKFLYNFQVNQLKKMEHFVKNDLKAKCMITSCNFGGNMVTTMIRNNFDAADDHMYVGHPTFLEKSWNLPHSYSQGSTLTREAPVPGCLFPGIIYGKPFFITELNFCAPVKYRSEGALLTGAYSALQDISGVYRFNFAGSIGRIHSKNKTIVPFESIYDPIMQVSNRIISAMFVRGDVKSSAEKISYTIPKDFWNKHHDSGYPWIRTLGLIARIGAVFAGHAFPGTFDYKHLPPEVKSRYEHFNKTKVAISTTNQIRLNASKGIMTVNTPKTAAVSIPKGKSSSSHILSVSQPDTFQTVAVISRDNKPLKESADIVMFQLTNVCSAGERYDSEERKIMRKYGKGPLLLRRGKINISLRLDSPRKVYALNLSGKIIGEIKSRYTNGELQFTADNGAFPGGIFGYSIR